MAVGTYATLDGLRERLFGPDAGASDNDDLLQSICDEVNTFLEFFCERVLGPVPTWSADVSGTAGTRTLTTAAYGAEGLSVGQRLLIGSLAGTYESATVLAISDDFDTITLRANLANSYTDDPAQRIAVLDGIKARGRRFLPYRPGVVALAAVLYDDGTEPTTWRLDPSEPPPGWPFSGVRVLDGDEFPSGRDDVLFIGPGPCAGMDDATAFGFPAVPEDVRTIAYNLCAGRWQMRATGGSYDLAPGTDTVQVGPYLLTTTDWLSLKSYKPRWALA